MKVSQVLCAAGPVDAVTNQALAWRAHLGRWGWGGEVFSAKAAPDMRRRDVRPLRDLEPEGQVLLLHYSGYGRGLERLFEGSARTMLLSHNVTPEEWFWPYEPVEAVLCSLGREQLHELAIRADRLAGVSAYNAQELRVVTGRQADVIGVLFDRSRLGPGHAGKDGGPPTVIFVGRLSPHKRQDLVIQAFGRFRSRQPAARLVLVGTPLSPAYGRELQGLAARVAPGAVTFETGLATEALAERYRSADVFLCLSEHEGFCLPLLEAFHFGLPVIARGVAAVPEVVGDAGILLAPEDDLATAAELISMVVEDAELRQELQRRGVRRLEGYEQSATVEHMRRTLAGLGEA